MHLLLTDICDKFSNSSSLFLSINARIGAGISKDSLKRFITRRCKELDEKQRYLTSNSFAIASFDNLDKNQSYSTVGVGKDKSGFHGTTIQTVKPCPTLQTNTIDTVHTSPSNHVPANLISETNTKSDSSVSARDRLLSVDLISGIINPDDSIGPPVNFSGNRFSHLSVDDFQCNDVESSVFNSFVIDTVKYGFTKSLLQTKKIMIPGFKSFFSIPLQETEKSEFTSVAILDETADKKETVLKVLNILHAKFQVGVKSDYVVVVGDGKSYDHLVKLKNEYGDNLNWVLAYPGDWHILKNLLPIYMKLYLDAGLKEIG